MAYSAGDGVSLDVDRLVGSKSTSKKPKDAGTKVSTWPTRDEIKAATISLLRRLMTLTQCLSPLPKKRDLVMRLEYHQDVTPPDYKPPFFETSFAPIVKAEKRGFEDVQVGAIATAHHSLTFRYAFDGYMPEKSPYFHKFFFATFFFQSDRFFIVLPLY